MILSDRSIKDAIASGRLGIDPFDPKLVQPSSIDVRLDNKFLVFRNTKRAFIDVKQPADDLMEMIEVGTDEPMFLHPHEFVLGSTIERVRMPDDLVARLEGRSSLGRLGVVIHSSLPYDEPVLFRDEGGQVAARPIGEIVENRLCGQVVAFDRDTFEVDFHRVTNWFRELPDRVYEVRLASGRRIRVTAGHNLFTLNTAGDLVKTPTRALQPGTRVAITNWIPESTDQPPEYRLVDLVSAEVRDRLVCEGPTVDALIESRGAAVRQQLREHGRSVSNCIRRRRLPLAMLREASIEPSPQDRIAHIGSSQWLPAVLRIDREIAWLLGLYVAKGHRRELQVNIANTDRRILDRAEAVFTRFGIDVYRGPGALTCYSKLLAAVFDGLRMGGRAHTRRLPIGFLSWPWQLIEALLEGVIAANGFTCPRRECIWTTSEGLVGDVLLACARLGKRAVTQKRAPRRRCLAAHVISIAAAASRDKVLTSATNPRQLLIDLPHEPALSQVAASHVCSFGHASDLNNAERDLSRRSPHNATLERVHDSGAKVVPSPFNPIGKLTRLVNGDIDWDRVVEVVDTSRFEVVYDLEVRSPAGRIQNFLAGLGGVFASNTAGFIDAAFDGHVTLEISNLANLPIALYPGMRIGQLSFSLMTTPAERPYGPGRGSKYSGQDLPTASRLYLDFK